MSDWLKENGLVRELVTKLGQLIILTIMWIVCCIPIITIVASSTAFYYAVVKTVRHEVGYPTKEFLHSFLSNLSRGLVQTVGIVIWLIILIWNWNMLKALDGANAYWLMIGQITLYIITACYIVTLFPAMSRFNLSGWRITKLTMLMALRSIPLTALSMIGWLGIGVLCYYVTLAFMLILPGIWVYISTFWVERILLRYMPPPQEGDTSWYYEDLKEKKNGEKVEE